MAISRTLIFNAVFMLFPEKNTIKNVCLLFIILFSATQAKSQTPLFSGVSVSDVGTGNNIGNAISSRNIATSLDGTIYIVYTGSSGIRVSKSTNRGQSFLSSVQISPINTEPEIVVNDSGIIFVSWIQSGNIMFSRSIDEGVTFSSPLIVGPGNFTVHMATFGNSIYFIDKLRENIHSNSNNGIGVFNSSVFTRHVFADILTDKNGVVYAPSDNPRLFLLESLDAGQNFSSVNINPSRNIFFSSYALSDGPCGTFIFVGGGGSNSTIGYKIDVSNGTNTVINLSENLSFRGRTLFADFTGTLIDGYQNSVGELMMNVSNDQGQTFNTPILIALGESHNITKNPFYSDVVVVYEQSGQVYVSVYDNLLKGITVVEADAPSVVCTERVFDLPYTLIGSFAPNTLFTAYLSDATGSFENETLIGSVTSNSSGTISCTVPNGIVVGNGYRVQIESSADCTQSNIVPLIVINPSTASVSSVSPICLGEDAVFTITGTPNSEVHYSGVVSSAANPVILDASGEATVMVLSPTADQTILLDSVNDSDGGCSTALNESNTVVVNPLPIFTLEKQYLLCVDVNGTEILNPPVIDTFLNTTDYSFEWFLDGSLQSQFNNQSAIAPIQSGKYEVEVTYITTSCSALNETIVYESSPAVITPRIVSSAFANRHSIEVEANNSGNTNAISEYEFSINDSTWELGSGSPGGIYTFTFDDNILIGTNTIKVRDAVGCGETEIEVVVMDYPHFFTPNNDGANDVWNITAPKTPINYLASAQIFIYNRYGKLLKQLNPLGAGWDGVFNGNILPTDDYWFVVNFIDPLDNQSKQFKAHFALKR